MTLQKQFGYDCTPLYKHSMPAFAGIRLRAWADKPEEQMLPALSVHRFVQSQGHLSRKGRSHGG